MSVKKILTGASNGLKDLVRSITGMRIISSIGRGANSSLGNLGKFVGKVPLGGKVVGYMFKQSGKGIVILATTSDNLINNAGNIVVDVLKNATDLTVLSLNTIEGSANRLSGMTKRRKKKRKKKKKKRTRRNR